MKHSQRPTEMLLRQLSALRSAAKHRNNETNQRHFCHLPMFREAFVRDIILIRNELKNRR